MPLRTAPTNLTPQYKGDLLNKEQNPFFIKKIPFITGVTRFLSLTIPLYSTPANPD